MRVILMSGLMVHKCAIWPNIEKALRSYLPNAQYELEEEKYCTSWDFMRMRDFADRVIDTYRGLGELLVVGHSMGGVLACKVAHELSAQVRGVVTIFSPHEYPIPATASIFGAQRRLATPVVSFGATRDEVVYWGSRHPYACAHEELDSDHLNDLVTKQSLAEQIAATTMRHITL